MNCEDVNDLVEVKYESGTRLKLKPQCFSGNGMYLRLSNVSLKEGERLEMAMSQNGVREVVDLKPIGGEYLYKVDQSYLDVWWQIRFFAMIQGDSYKYTDMEIDMYKFKTVKPEGDQG